MRGHRDPPFQLLIDPLADVVVVVVEGGLGRGQEHSMVVRRPPQLSRANVGAEYPSRLQEASPACVPEGRGAAAVQEHRVGPLFEKVLRDPALAPARGVVQRRLLGDGVQHRPRGLGQLDVGVDLRGVGGVEGVGREW